jgi:hypothetical protein
MMQYPEYLGPASSMLLSSCFWCLLPLFLLLETSTSVIYSLPKEPLSLDPLHLIIVPILFRAKAPDPI